jgi:hypothetical protein
MSKQLTISNETDLRMRIMQLEALKDQQEQELRSSIRELYSAIDPVSMIKKTVTKLAEDKEVQQGVAQMGLKLGTDYLIGKIIGKNDSIRKYISSIFVEKAANYIISNHSDKLLSGVQHLIGFIKKAGSKNDGSE